jgi:hypothetical protein
MIRATKGREKRPMIEGARGAALAATLAGGAAMADPVDGRWRTETSDRGSWLIVEIGPCENDAAQRCGVIAEAHNATRDDLKGRAIIWDMAPRPRDAGRTGASTHRTGIRPTTRA